VHLEDEQQDEDSNSVPGLLDEANIIESSPVLRSSEPLGVTDSLDGTILEDSPRLRNARIPSEGERARDGLYRKNEKTEDMLVDNPVKRTIKGKRSIQNVDNPTFNKGIGHPAERPRKSLKSRANHTKQQNDISDSTLKPRLSRNVKDTKDQPIRSKYERCLKAKGLEIRRMQGDGNCLFRAVSLQIYGDPSWHGEVRKHVVNYMKSERIYFSQFIIENYNDYINRMANDGCFGSNPEIQAMVEVYNRAVEVYQCPPESVESSGSSSLSKVNSSSSSSASLAPKPPETEKIEPMNTFQCSYKTANPPIRLLYSNGNHYDAIVDPYEATVGIGLGLPGLESSGVEKSRLKKACKESKKSLEKMDNIFMNKTRHISDREATENALEEAAIKASLRDFWAQQHRPRNESKGNGTSFEQKRKATNGNASASSSSGKEKMENKFPAYRMNPNAKQSTQGYPAVVEELVFNGFPSDKVLNAYAVVGNNFDALVSMLLRDS